ncbi:MAG: hypothetical protein ACKVOU_13270 [Cytophagales bacterium]
MLSIRGKYQNGILQLEKPFDAKEVVEVIVTFLEIENSKLKKRKSLLEKLKNGPVMSDEQYQEYLEGREWWKNSRLSK